jgi:outer membrane protein
MTRASRLTISACLGLMSALPAAAFPTFDPWYVMPGAAPIRVMPGDSGVEQVLCQGGEAPSPVGLHQALEMALCHNPQTRQSWAVALAQGAQVGQATGAFLPTVNGSLSYSRDEISTQQGANRARTDINAEGRNLTLSYVLLDFGTRGAYLDQTRHALSAALASHDATLQAVFANTAQSYYDALAAQAALETAQGSEAAAKENVQAGRAREEAGSGFRAEVLQAQSAYAQAVAARVKAEGVHRMAVGTLANVMGLDARTPLVLDQSSQDLLNSQASAADTEQFLRDLDGLMDQALKNHPSVRSAQAQLSAAQSRLEAVTTEGLPSLGLNIGRYINGRPNTQLSPSQSYETLGVVTLSIPIFEGFARNYKIKEASAQVEARRADLRGAQAQASLDLWRAYQSLQVETASLAASVDLLSSGQEVVDAARARYKSGTIHIMELLEAQKDLASAQQERIRSLAAWRTARLRLLASLGRVGFWALEQGAPASTGTAP